jgi:C1A family cysteine protease
MLKHTLLLLIGILVIISNVSGESIDPKINQELKIIQNNISANGHIWIAGNTSMSNLSLDEKRHRLGLIWQPSASLKLPAINNNATIASAWDWRNVKSTSWVTPIKDQGDCGSCVAFATVGTIESSVEISRSNTKPIPDLSEADLFFGGGASCSGWQFESALERAKIKGIADETCWPYPDGPGPCSDRDNRITKIASWQTVSNPKDWIATNGPIMAGMEVNSDFFWYDGGIYIPEYGDYMGNHAVTVIGYDDSQNCWICKNSWGTEWGESGFFKIAYGQCGMGTLFPFYAVQMSQSPPTGYGVITLQKSGPVSLTIGSLRNSHIRELHIVSPTNKQICKVTNSVVGQKFDLGTFNAGDSLVFKIVTDSGTFYSAKNMNPGSISHMFLLQNGANSWQMGWGIRSNSFRDMACSLS